MTNEQAISWLKNYRKYTNFEMPQYEDAFDMAIQALQAQQITPTADFATALKKISDYEQTQADGDLICRQDIDECKELMRATNGETVYAVRMSDIRQLPSVAIPSDKCNPNDCPHPYGTYETCLKCKEDGDNKSVAIPQAEKTCNIEESNFDMRQYKLDTDTAYECGYKAGLRVQKDGDLISRQALLDRLDDFNKWCKDGRLQGSLFAVDVIKDMPSVAIPNKVGHWIGHREHCENLGVMPSGLGCYEWCSNCDCGIDVREWHRNHYNYCPNCGTKMV